MIIWERLGWLVPIVGLLGMILIQLTIELVFGTDVYKQNILYQNAAVIFGGGLVFIVGKHLNHPDRIIIRCKQTKELLEIKDKHTFFFIPFEWCGLVLGILFLLIINEDIFNT